jgi:DhnA family fructose-bisphosphate aldolase class Ia
VYQPLEHLNQGGAVLDSDQGHGKTVASAHDVGGGLGMEVGRAAFGLTTVDLVDALMRLTRVGEQSQVNRHALGPLAQAFGDLSRKQPIQSLF